MKTIRVAPLESKVQLVLASLLLLAYLVTLFDPSMFLVALLSQFALGVIQLLSALVGTLVSGHRYKAVYLVASIAYLALLILGGNAIYLLSSGPISLDSIAQELLLVFVIVIPVVAAFGYGYICRIPAHETHSCPPEELV